MAPDRINFIHNGSIINISRELLEDLLTTAGYSIQSLVPLEVIDKVGFLKTGDDAKQIVVDLLAKSLPDGDADVTSANWPFPTSATDTQGTLDLGDDIDIDLGTVYYDQAMNADNA
jgi:hypothetical protein